MKCVVLLCLALPLCAQVSRSVPDTASVVASTAASLSRLHNVTCEATVHRWRQEGNHRPRLVANSHLEVLLVDGREVYAQAGGARFENTSLLDLLRGGNGVATEGEFAGHARNIFIERAAVIRTAARQPLRFDFTDKPAARWWVFRSGAERSAVRSTGSFWIDPNTFGLRTLVVRASRIAPELGVDDAEITVDFRQETIDGLTYTFPVRSRSTILYNTGNRSRNETEYSHCHRFAAESRLLADASDGN